MLREYPYTTNKQKYLSLTTKQLYNPMPHEFRVRLAHEQDYLASFITLQPLMFVRSSICPRGLTIGLDPAEEFWTYPAGMKDLHAIYANSWVESAMITWTVSDQATLRPFEAVFFMLNSADVIDYVDGFGEPTLDVPLERLDSIRSMPGSITKMVSFGNGGYPVASCVQSVDLRALNNDFVSSLDYCTVSNHRGSMDLRQFLAGVFSRTPVFGVVYNSIDGNGIQPKITFKIEFNMRFGNLHPAKTVNPLVPDPDA